RRRLLILHRVAIVFSRAGYRRSGLDPRILRPMNGFLQHLRLTLKLNFRNPQAVVFGYVVPVFFLFAIAAFYVKGKNPGPEMARYMGQLLTITILGGACFGMPIA